MSNEENLEIWKIQLRKRKTSSQIRKEKILEGITRQLQKQKKEE
jgi:hypothetical protein